MTETRSHVHEESFSQSAAAVFRLLHQPSAIRKWWGAAYAIVIPRAGGFWAAAWGSNEDAPDYITSARLTVFEPPYRMVMADFCYFAHSGPLPFQADFETEFLVTDEASGCRLTVTQRGFPPGPVADDYYAACQTGWAETFAGIRRYLDG